MRICERVCNNEVFAAKLSDCCCRDISTVNDQVEKQLH